MSSTSPFASAASALAGWTHRAAALCWRHGTATTLWTLRTLRGLIGLIVVAWSVLLIAWLTLYWGILPRIEQWRPQIEARATQALGVPVRIGHIEVRSTGWVPALELRDVVLLDAQSREALRLPRVAAAVSARSLLAFSLRFEQLLIEGPQLDIRRDAQGRLWVAGLALSEARRDEGDTDAATDWLFDQGEFVIRSGALRWTDEQRGAPPLALSGVDLVIRNGLRRHDLRLDATPPPEWGERFSLRGRLHSPLLGRSGDWRRWSGSLYADLPRARVADVRRHLNLPFELTQGEGRVRAWLDVTHGEARGATVDVALRDVSLRLTPQVEPMVFSQVSGRFVGTRSNDGMSLTAQSFAFVTGEGMSWPAGDLRLSVRQRKAATEQAAPAASPPLGAEVIGGELLAERLDLALMAQIASRVPLPDALRTLLAEADPRGSITGLSVGWEGPLAQPQRYKAKARFAGFSIAAKAAPEPASPGRPGWRNADIDLQATEKGGDATLTIRDGALDFPGVFAESLVPLERFDAKLAWHIDRSARQPLPAIELKVRDARFANADLQGEANATWSTGPGTGFARGARFPGQIDLSGKLIQARAASTARYLPLGIPEEPRQYVARAVRGGTITGALFKVKGDLWDFPYAGAKQHGEFRIVGKVDDVTLAYVPPKDGVEAEWPVFNKVSAELVFDRASMEIRNAQAQVYGVALSQIQAGIRDMDKRPLLTVQGQGRGPLADMLRYVNASPVNEWTQHALAQASGGGLADLKLALSFPLQKLADSTVKGSVLLAGNDVRIRPDTPLLGAAKARVDFTHKGVTVAGGSARVLGGDATFDGHTTPDGALRFSGQGVATADGLRRASELGWPAKLATSLAGQAPYKLAMNVAHGHTELALTSTLVGMSSDLPAPLRKAADASLPLRYQTSLQADGTRDVLRFELGNVVQAQFQRDLTHDAPQVLRGGIGVMEPAPQPATGVQAVMSVPQFNADAWQTTATRIFGSTAAAGSSGGGDGYLPHSVAFRAQELVTSGRTLTHVVAGLSRDMAGDENLWRANLEADQLGGYVEYRPARSASAAGRIYARLARLALPKSEADTVESLLDKSPATVPALDVVVDDFELRGKKLGRIEIEAVNRGTGEWRLAKFNMITPEARFAGSGQWGGAQGSKRRMVMDFKLELSDSGAYLQRLTGERSLRGGKGRMQGQLSWGGSPLSLDYPSLAGQINVALDSGQFLKAEPGAARLLSVLSLQSLPRRLVLDFRDVFQEGFAFDSVTGDVKIERGQASTNNLRMRGVQAAVLMEGQADIERETQNLRVVVVPEINAGTASLAYAAINPAVGLGTFLAQLVLRKPIIAAGTREFRVTGPWADPKVDRIERKPGEPIPEIESPPTTPKS
jgi:uncharacterized protein (TIGR02099 family)